MPTTTETSTKPVVVHRTDEKWASSLKGLKLRVPIHWWREHKTDKSRRLYEGEITTYHSDGEQPYWKWRCHGEQYPIFYCDILLYVDDDYKIENDYDLPPRPPTTTQIMRETVNPSTQIARTVPKQQQPRLNADEIPFACQFCKAVGKKVVFQSNRNLISHLRRCESYAARRRRKQSAVRRHSVRVPAIQMTHSHKSHINRMQSEHAKPQNRAVDQKDDAVFRRPGLREHACLASEHRAEMGMQIEQLETKTKQKQANAGAGAEANAGERAHDTTSIGDVDDNVSVDDAGSFGGGAAPMVCEDEDWTDFELFDEKAGKWMSLVHGHGTKTDFAEPFKYRGNLPIYYQMHLCLMTMLSRTQCDLGLHDRIVDMMFHFHRIQPSMLSDAKAKFDAHTRGSVLTYISRFFEQKDISPQAVTMDIDNGTKRVTVPTRDFETELTRVLTNPFLMKEENLIDSPTFDRLTLRPTKTYEELGPHDVIDEFHTGYLYSEGVKRFCSGPTPPGVDMVIPLPLIAYTDETNTDVFGARSYEKISWSCAWFSHESLSKEEFWFDTGSMPNLAIGHGRYANTFDDVYETNGGTKDVTKAKAARQKLIDTQRIYTHLHKSVIECCDRGGVRVMYRGQKCLFKPFLLCCKGDAKGLNTICGHYNANGSRGVNCLCKDCKCNPLDVTRPVCERITLEDLERAYKDPEYARAISYHDVPSAWNDLPLAESVEGISGSTPYDHLHVHGGGSYPDGMKYLHDLCGKKAAGSKYKEQLDLLFEHVAGFLYQSNSERRIPRRSNRFGLMDLTRRTGEEAKGNYFTVVVCLSTDRGREIIQTVVDHKNKSIAKRNSDREEREKTNQTLEGEEEFEDELEIDVDNITSTMVLLLAYAEWAYGPKLKWELDDADEAVYDLMERLTTHLPLEKIEKEKGSKESGSNGYDKIKFHAIWIILGYLRKYGSARGTDTSANEEHHKTTTIVANETQQRADSFAYQVNCRDGERRLILSSAQYVSHNFPEDKRHVYSTSTKALDAENRGGIDEEDVDGILYLGQYELQCEPHQAQEVVDYTIHWKSKIHNSLGTEVSTQLTHAITDHCLRQARWTRKFVIRGFTELRVPSDAGNTIYRSTTDFGGRERYDWALFNEANPTDIGYDSSFYIGKIVGIFSFETPGYPTPKRLHQLRQQMGVQNARKEILATGDVDNTMYVAVQTSESCYSKDALLEKMVTPFCLDGEGDQLRILSVTKIREPALVCPNIGASNKLSYLYVLPKHKWGQLFRRSIEATTDRHISKKTRLQ